MKTSNKISLDTLKVNSFITVMNTDKQQTVQGGMHNLSSDDLDEFINV